MIKRRRAKTIKIGHINIGANHPIAIQSMTKTHTKDIEPTLKQIKELELSGCEIIRLSVMDFEDARAIKKIKSFSNSPLVADIHFNFRLALAAIDNGIDKIRLNPGNLYKKDQIRDVVRAAKIAHIPIRVGVNSGSLRNSASGLRHQVSSANRLIKSALSYIRILEKFGFYDIVVSLKASNIFDTIEAYRKMACVCDYPFHVGMTATGLASYGIIKSAISSGTLLLEGIGDTIRVSLTDKPQAEVKAAKYILGSLGLRRFGPQIISCPTCGRCEVDLIKLVKEFEDKLNSVSCKLNSHPVGIALMGCMVNGPGEAKEADIGIAFGKEKGLLFKRGKAIKKVSFSNCAGILLKEMEKIND